MINARARGTIDVPCRATLEDAGVGYSHPNDKFDPARDVTIAEVDGELVAFG